MNLLLHVGVPVYWYTKDGETIPATVIKINRRESRVKIYFVRDKRLCTRWVLPENLQRQDGVSCVA